MAGSIRPRLASAIAKLKEAGAYDEAAAVESVTGPRGYLLLRRTETGSTDALSITTNLLLKQAINETAEDWDLVLDGLAEEAYRKVRDEGWAPPEAGRAAKGSRGTKAVLQVDVDSELRQEVQALLPALSERVGYRVTEANIVLTHVCEELGIERPNTAAVDTLKAYIPVQLRDHVESEAARLGLDLRQIAEDGITDLLNGAWVPERHPYFADKAGYKASKQERGSGEGPSSSEAPRMAWVKLRVNKELLKQMRAHLDELSERLGWLVTPGLVLRAILINRFGTPAG